MRLSLLLAALWLAPMAGGAVLAQEVPVSDPVQVSKREPETRAMLIEFRGGTVERNIAAVIFALLDEPDLIPVDEHLVAAGDSMCALLAARGLPGGCDSYRAIVERLNHKSVDRLSIGDSVFLPRLDLRKGRSLRSEEGASGYGRLESILKSWKTLNPVMVRDAFRSKITFDTFELRVTALDIAQFDRARLALTKLGLLNTSFQPLGIDTPQSAPFSDTADDVRARCDNTGLRDGPVDYVNYAFEDRPAVRASNGPATGTNVIILDLPLMQPPNLQLPPDPPAWSCRWHAFVMRDHATHMAGIIGSRNPDYGFVGLAQTSMIRSLPYRQPAAQPDETPPRDNDALKLYADMLIGPDVFGGPLPVFLVASSIYEPSDYKGALGGMLLSAGHRFNGELAAVPYAVLHGDPMLIVAAGQDPRLPEGLELAARLPMMPQNLGDLPNVLVVTACERCARQDASIRRDANYDKGRRFVHVAAPGGNPLPGWINPDGLGAAGGTSQSAAYVAGVAADIIARYPHRYTRPRTVKQRLQVTSWPLLGSSTTFVPDANRLAAGIVDPEVAALDPGRDWIRTAEGWRPLRVRRWTVPDPQFRNTSGVRRRDLMSVLRLIQVDQHFILYEDRSDDDADAPASGVIRTIDAGTPVPAPQMPMLEPCEGSPIRLADILDFIPRVGGLPQTEALACS